MILSVLFMKSRRCWQNMYVQIICTLTSFFTFQMVVQAGTKITFLLTYVTINKILDLMQSGHFLPGHRISLCDGIGGFVKRYVAKRSLQRPQNNQILDYKAFIELCKEEIKGISFIDISQSHMNDV